MAILLIKLRIIVKTEIIRLSILLQEEFTGTEENIILAVKLELCALLQPCVDRDLDLIMGNVRPAVEGSVMICYSCFKLGMLASVVCCFLHSFHQTAAALFTSTSAFFARDNVALPGVAFYFKVKLQLPLKQCMHACMQMFFLKENLRSILQFLGRLCIMDPKTLVDIIFSLGLTNLNVDWKIFFL